MLCTILISPARRADRNAIMYMYRLLHKYGYLHYFRDLRNGRIITEGEARGDYCAILKVSKKYRYPYLCNNLLLLWLVASLVTMDHH